jgi:hypothetical protein
VAFEVKSQREVDPQPPAIGEESAAKIAAPISRRRFWPA